MKNTKKIPVKQLENFSNIFTQLGLVLVLFIVYVTLEHRTEQKAVINFSPSFEAGIVYLEPNTEIIFTKEIKEVFKVPVIKDVFILDDPIKKDDNSAIETIIDHTPIKIPTQVDIDKLVEVIIKEAITEDIPYDFVQNAPVFKGCENLSKKETRICFDKKMNQFVQRNFDVSLANELGLHSGKHKIQTQFTINQSGNIIDVRIRAPHKKLEKEAQRIIKKLPKFKSGKQNNKNVKVRYLLPITFKIE